MLKISECRYGKEGKNVAYCKHPEVVGDPEYVSGTDAEGNRHVTFPLSKEGVCVNFACPMDRERDIGELIIMTCEALESLGEKIKKGEEIE